MIVDNQEVIVLNHYSGSCHGIDVKLMQDTVDFDVVVVNSKKVKRL